MHARSLLKVLELLQFDENVRLSTLRVFLYIAAKGRVSIVDIARDLEIAAPAAQRAVQRLGKGSPESHAVGPGLGLIRRHVDPANPKQYLYELNNRGTLIASGALTL